MPQGEAERTTRPGESSVKLQETKSVYLISAHHALHVYTSMCE